MKSGLLGNADTTAMDPVEELKIMSLIMTFLEYAMKNANEYVNIMGRNGITTKDLEYAMKNEVFAFLTRNQAEIQEKTAEYFEDISQDYHQSSDEESDSDEMDLDEFTIDDSELEEFTRYTGNTDELCIQMNESYDRWNDWVPENDFETSLKQSIDNTFKN
jgi:hypothetical protein